MRAQLLNNSLGPIYAQMPHAGTDAGKQVVLGEMVIIQPGLNLIDAKTLETLRKNPTFEGFFKAVIKPTRAPEADPLKFGKPILQIFDKTLVPDGSPFEKMDDGQAVAMVNETQSTDLLQEWMKGLNRQEVRKAIEARLETLAAQIQKSAKSA